MATWRINNATVLGNFVCAQWVANTAYALGDRVVCTISYGTFARRALVYECTIAGTSHATTQPTWPTSGTVADNTVVWTTRNPNDGNWNNASCILHYVLNHAAVVAGDFIYIHNAHSESVSFGSQYQILGTATVNNPIKIICVDKATDSLSTGAIVRNSATGAFEYLWFLNYGYSYGVSFISNADIYFGASNAYCGWIIEGNATDLLTLNTSAKFIRPGTGGASYTYWLKLIKGNINLQNANNYIFWAGGQALFEWKSGSLVAPNAITKLFDGASTILNVFVEDVDLNAIGAGSILDVADGNYGGNVFFLRCKLNAGTNRTTGSWVRKGQGKVHFHHCSSANDTYNFQEHCYEGQIDDETSIVRSGGTSDGTTPQSWKMVSSANVLDNYHPLISPPIQSWTNSITSKTFTIECIVDSATNLQNDEVWMEFEYPVDNTSGLGGFARDKCAILGTPADKSSSTVTWDGTGGMANPNKFKCQVTVTPGKAGPITARICLAKASTTIYIDPLITES